MTGIVYDVDCGWWCVLIGHEFPDSKDDDYEYIGGAKTVSEAAAMLLEAVLDKLRKETAKEAYLLGSLDLQIGDKRLERARWYRMMGLPFPVDSDDPEDP